VIICCFGDFHIGGSSPSTGAKKVAWPKIVRILIVKGGKAPQLQKGYSMTFDLFFQFETEDGSVQISSLTDRGKEFI